MIDMFQIKDGGVVALLHGVPVLSDLQARLAEARASADTLEARGVKPVGPTPEEMRDLIRNPASVSEGRRAEIELVRLRHAIEVIEGEVAAYPSLLPAEVYSESAIGQPLAWPRAYRAARLAETDYVDLPGWRAGKDADRLAAADAYRRALRDLRETYPDPATVVWPERPAGL